MAVSEWVEASPTCYPNPDDSSMVANLRYHAADRVAVLRNAAGRRRVAAIGISALCGGFRPPGWRPIHALRRPAAEKRQGTKSREVEYRRGHGRYGDLMPAPSSVVDVMLAECGRLPASRLLLPRSGLERSDFVPWHEPDQPGWSTDVR